MRCPRTDQRVPGSEAVSKGIAPRVSDVWLEPLLGAQAHKMRPAWAPLCLRRLLSPGEPQGLATDGGLPRPVRT